MMSHSMPRISALRTWMQALATEYRSAYIRKVPNEASLNPSDPGTPIGMFQPTGISRCRGGGRSSSSSGTFTGVGVIGVSGVNVPARNSITSRGRGRPSWCPPIISWYCCTSGDMFLRTSLRFFARWSAATTLAGSVTGAGPRSWPG